MKFILSFGFAVLILISCSSLAVPENAPSPVATRLPSTSTPSRQYPVPSSTDIQLPFNPDMGSDEYCKPPYAVLPVEDGNDISEDEITHELVNIWLRRYKQTGAPPACRIEDYTIEKVYSDPSVYSQALEPRGDFMRVVVFSVKPIQIPSDWMSFPGELDQDNWLHVSHIVAVTKTNEGYTLEFAYP